MSVGPGMGAALREEFSRALAWLAEAGQLEDADQLELGRGFYERLLGKPPPAHGPVPAVPVAGLDQIAMRLLAPNPVDRYPSLESLCWDLEHWQEPGFVAASAFLRKQPAEPAMVGRQRELEQLFLSEGMTQVLAPAGMGKTRLLEEAARWALGAGWTVWRAECLQSSHQSFQPFQELAAQLARRADLWPDLEARLGEWLPAVLRLFPLLRPLSLVAPEQVGSGEFLHQRNREASLRLLLAMGPAVFVVDDLHWAEPEVVECLAQLPWPVWAGSREPIAQAERSMRLEPLDGVDLGLLARSMCGPVECPELALWSQGHPLQAAALQRSLCESGALVQGEGGWVRSARQPSWGALSPTLEELLRQRSQALSPETQRRLRQAALLGRRFALELLEDADLSEAQQKGLVYPVETGVWDFTHDLIWQELRRASAPAEKLEFHARVAARLLARPQPPAEAVAEHLWQSNQLAECLPWTLLAARQGSSLEASAHFWGRAAHLQTQQFEPRYQWGCVLRQLGRYREAGQVLEQALALGSDAWERACCRSQLGESAWRSGDLPTAAQHFREGLADLDVRVPSGVSRWWGVVRELCGTFGRVRTLNERQRLAARMLDQLAYAVVYSDGIGFVWSNLRGLRLTAGSRSLERGILLASHAVLILYVPALLGRARRCIAEALELVAGDPHQLACTQARHGSILLFTGELTRAVATARVALAQLAREGDRYDSRMTRYNVAFGQYWLGELEESRQLAMQGWQEACQARDWLAAGLSGRVLAALGVVPEGFYRHFEAPNPQPHVEVLRLEILGLLQLERGRPEPAAAYLEQAVALSRRLGLSLDRAWQSSWLATAYRMQAELVPLAQRPGLFRKGRVAAQAACKLGRAGYPVYLPHALRELGWCELGLGRATRGFAESLDWAQCLLMDLQARITRAEMARAGLPVDQPRPAGTFWQFRAPEASAQRLAACFDEAVHHARRVLQAHSAAEVLVRAEEAAVGLLGATSCRVEAGVLQAARVEHTPARSQARSSLLIPLGGRWGQLVCDQHHLPDRFGEAEVHLGAFLGTVVGAALDNAAMLEELRGREQWLAQLFEGVPVGVASLDAQGRIVQANTALREMLGDQLAGRPLSEFVYRGGIPGEERYLGRQGNLIWADQRVTRLDADRSVVSLSDVSWRRLHQVAAFQEQERRLLGIEVHDVSQPLIGLCYQLSAQGQHESAAIARKLLAELRGLLFDLRTPALEEFDLSQSLHDLVHEVTSLQSQVEISLQVSGLVALFAYRIVVEGMSNVRRHSGAGRVLLRLRRVGGQLSGSLWDDGHGSSARRGYGLQGISDRAGLLGGWARLRSLGERGSLLHFRLPLEQS